MSTLRSDIEKAKIDLRKAVVLIAQANNTLKRVTLAKMVDQLNGEAK